MAFALFRKGIDAQAVARDLYEAAVAQSREPAFYAVQGVPDSLDGRFDMIALHVYLVLRRLKRPAGGTDGEDDSGRDAAEVGQALFDVFFADMDQNLREIGVGDMSVGKRVKAMARGLYGRIEAYDGGLADAGAEGEAALREALRRNLYGTCDTPPDDAALAAMAGYVRGTAAALDGAGMPGLLDGAVGFPPAPGASGT